MKGCAGFGFSVLLGALAGVVSDSPAVGGLVFVLVMFALGAFA